MMDDALLKDAAARHLNVKADDVVLFEQDLISDSVAAENAISLLGPSAVPSEFQGLHVAFQVRCHSEDEVPDVERRLNLLAESGAAAQGGASELADHGLAAVSWRYVRSSASSSRESGGAPTANGTPYDHAAL